MDIKEYAWSIIEKFYYEGYITSREEIAFYEALSTATAYNNHFSSSITVEGRKLTFVCAAIGKHFVSFDDSESDLSAYMYVFISQYELDFTVNYNFENNKFLVDELHIY